MKERYQVIFFAIVAILCVSLVAVAVVFSYFEDPRQYDKEYCNDYAQWIDWRIALKPEQTINVAVAERVCECRWNPLPENAVYRGYTECWRR